MFCTAGWNKWICNREGGVMARKLKLWSTLFLLLCLGGCIQGHTDIPLEEVSQPPSSNSSKVAASMPEAEKTPAAAPSDFAPYQAPEFARADFDPSAAEGGNGVRVDLSGLSRGYVAVTANSDRRMKFRVEMGEKVYNYDLPSDGTPTIYPLQSGDGSYVFRALANTAGTNYAEIYSTQAEVQLDDEFQPFLRPSQYVDYSEGSRCVKLAAELASQQPDALGVVEAVFDYICEHVTYDKEKAATVNKGYLPQPDETLTSGKGICFDYACLVAAMLRSQGIPTKMVFGYVQPGDLYIYLIMFYTDESGWVTVEYEVESNSWSRLDMTFAANGADPQFIGDGTNYTDVYFY